MSGQAENDDCRRWLGEFPRLGCYKWFQVAALGDLTDPEAVLDAIAEYDRLGQDAFLQRYGFGVATRYLLEYGDGYYDSKAIVGAAFGHQHGQPLRPDEFAGGHGHAVTALERLGFTVVDTATPWSDDELMLALQTYLLNRQQRLGPRDAAITTLRERLIAMAARSGRPTPGPFRGASEVARNVDAFRALDPERSHPARARPREEHGRLWEQYQHSPYRYRLRMKAVSEAAQPLAANEARGRVRPPAVVTGPRTPRERVEAAQLDEPYAPLTVRDSATRAPVWVDPERYDRGSRAHEATRDRLHDHLRDVGFQLGQGKRGAGIEYDLSARREQLTLLVEVKSLPEDAAGQHAQLRLGLGQVLWYRSRFRERTGETVVAVLAVERAPVDADLWWQTCAEASVVLTWPQRFHKLEEESRRFAG